MSEREPRSSYRKRRTVELFMLLGAVALGLIGCRVHQPQSVRRGAGQSAGRRRYLRLALAAHLLVRWRLPYADPLLLPSVFLLNGLGLAMIHRIDQIPDPVKHDVRLPSSCGTGLALVFFAGVVVFARPPRAAAVPVHAVPHRPRSAAAPAGARLGYGGEEGSQIWIRIAGRSFQPAEVAKVVLAIAFASYLVESATCSRSPVDASSASTCPGPATSARSSTMWGASSPSWCSSATSAPSLLFFGLFVIMLYVATERPSC